MFAFASDEVHASVNVVAEWIRNLANLRPPNLKTTSDPWLDQVKARLQYFVQVAPKGAADAGKPKVGKEGIAAAIDDIGQKVTKGETVELKELQLLDAYSWLLDAGQKSKHQEWVKAVFAKADTQAAITTTSSSSSSSSPSAPPAPRAKLDATKAKAPAATTMSIFKKKNV